MATARQQVLQANEEYVKRFGDLDTLAMPPARHFAILTCMDARLDPAKYGGLREGDAHVIRNAGGRVTDDAIRSLVISHKLLGTTEWLVVHHTNCGMETFTDQVMRELLGAAWTPPSSTAAAGATWGAARAPPKASSSTGSPSTTRRPAWCGTCGGSAPTPWYRATSPSRASSTT
ncbi:MAG: carbonic anhydrase [Anaeromyxobacter sp.]|nr:carbonic anhydrase [Anaeromyxobacter sp.]